MGEVAVIQTKDLLSSSDLSVLKNSKFKGFTDPEISYARSVCAHLQLNPLLNQIHFVKRKNHADGTYSVTVQVGIDGFRLAAERTSKYAGSDDPVFEYRPNDTQRKQPAKATVTVYKVIDGVRCPFTASARWEEYYPGDGKMGAMWRKMPHGQLGKCAEALALRKAFPAELSALRTDEEMAQSEREVVSKASQLNARGTAAPTEAVIEEAEFSEAPSEGPPPTEGLGEFVCQVGKKFKGKKLKEISLDDLSSFVSWIREQDDASPALTTFAEKAEAFMGNGTDMNEMSE
jgi:phage recombination protein Bet